MYTNLKDNSNKDTGGPTKQMLIKKAALLFAQLETSYVWTCCGEQFSQACSTMDVDGEGMDMSVDVRGIGST